MSNKTIVERPIYRYLQLITVVFLSNCCFILFLAPFLILFFNMSVSISNIMIYCIALIPSSVGLQGLLGTMLIFERDKSANILHDFFSAVKDNWRQSLLFGTIFFTGAMILLIDMLHAAAEASWLMLGIYAVLSFIFITYYLLIMILTAKYEMSLKEILKLGVYTMVFHFTKSVRLFSCITCLIIGFWYMPSLSLLVVFGLFAWLLVKASQKIFYVLMKELGGEQ